MLIDDDDFATSQLAASSFVSLSNKESRINRNQLFVHSLITAIITLCADRSKSSSRMEEEGHHCQASVVNCTAGKQITLSDDAAYLLLAVAVRDTCMLYITPNIYIYTGLGGRCWMNTTTSSLDDTHCCGTVAAKDEQNWTAAWCI